MFTSNRSKNSFHYVIMSRRFFKIDYIVYDIKIFFFCRHHDFFFKIEMLISIWIDCFKMTIIFKNFFKLNHMVVSFTICIIRSFHIPVITSSTYNSRNRCNKANRNTKIIISRNTYSKTIISISFFFTFIAFRFFKLNE